MYKARYLYSELASAIQARNNCDNASPRNTEWFDKHTQTIKLLESLLPSGSGFDSGTGIVIEASHAEKLVLSADFQHMNDGGFYDGWTEHTITVTPSFDSGFNLRISGRDRNEIKDHIADVFDNALRQDVTYDLLRERFPQFAVTSKWEDKDGTASQCYQVWYCNGEYFGYDFQTAKNRAAYLMAEGK